MPQVKLAPIEKHHKPFKVSHLELNLCILILSLAPKLSQGQALIRVEFCDIQWLCAVRGSIVRAARVVQFGNPSVLAVSVTKASPDVSLKFSTIMAYPLVSISSTTTSIQTKSSSAAQAPLSSVSFDGFVVSKPSPFLFFPDLSLNLDFLGFFLMWLTLQLLHVKSPSLPF